jgi:topoisomerase-4 subunit A
MRQVMMADDDQLWLMASDAGYGFICKSSDMVSKNKSGKALLTVPEKSLVLPPQPIADINNDQIMAITNEGRMLLFPIKDLPQLGKGKGNKIINIPSARAKAREEFLSYLTVITADSHVTLYAGKRKLGLKPSDLENFRGERGRRGSMLPRGLQRVTDIEIDSPQTAIDEQLTNS